MKIKWTNKFSHEQGFVKAINKKGKYFENTFDIAEAKNFACKTIGSNIALLNEYCVDNVYSAVDKFGNAVAVAN